MEIVDQLGKKIRLDKIDTEAPKKEKEQVRREKTAAITASFEKFQFRLYAENKRSLLVIFQGLDASGKDGVTRKVLEPLSPQGVSVTSFKAPEPKELAHDFLWRIHQCVPPKGSIGVFNRSHYEDVLVVRVKKLIEKEAWKARYQHINDFERLLVENGTTILKFYLHISKKEQQKRFVERQNNPDKYWKFNKEDLEVQDLWSEYQDAYEDVFAKCSTDYAPWHIIPADDKWYRDYCVAKVIAKAFEKMNPQFPKQKIEE